MEHEKYLRQFEDAFSCKPLEAHSVPSPGMRIQSSLMNTSNSLMDEILNDMKPRDQHD